MIEDDGGFVISAEQLGITEDKLDEFMKSLHESCDICGCCCGTHYKCPRQVRAFPLFAHKGLSLKFVSKSGETVAHCLSQECVDAIVEKLF